MLVSSSDITRIKNSIEERTKVREAGRDVSLHAASIKRSSEWTNTLEAQRIQAQEERSREKLAEEALRQSIDIQEAQIQFAKRKADITRANQLL